MCNGRMKVLAVSVVDDVGDFTVLLLQQAIHSCDSASITTDLQLHPLRDLQLFQCCNALEIDALSLLLLNRTVCRDGP